MQPFRAASPVRTHPRRGARRVGLLTAVALLAVLALPSSAQANEEETEEANLLVLQSISLIANDNEPDVIAERVADALEAPDKSGVDLAKVQQALTLVEESATSSDSAEKIAQARTLLVDAIDIRAATGYGEIPEPGEVGEDTAPYATGAESGTTVVLDELNPARGVSDGGDAVLLAAGIAILLAGLYLSRRWRPHESIHELRRRSAALDTKEELS